VIDDWAIADNAILGLHRREPVSNGWTIDQSGKMAAVNDIVQRFNTKISTPDAPMSSLSGGNQQRFVVARSLQGDPKLLIAFQPSRGVDIRGSIDVYREIRRRCQSGMCALVVSFDLDELIEHCDRILVMFDGRISEPPTGARTDRHAIGRMMVGLSP
jgi:simple sugar transport system ATP-binding protein